MRTHRSLKLFLLSALLGTAAGAARAQSDSIWRDSLGPKIEFFAVTPLGNLVVRSDSGLSALDLATGTTLWTRPDVRSYDVVGFTGSSVSVTPEGLAVIDLATGATRWRLSKLPLSKVRSYVALPELSMLMVYGETAESRLTVVAAGLDTGEVRWRQDSLFSVTPKFAEHSDKITLARAQPPLIDSDTTLILYPAYGGPIKIHSRTGRLLWRADTLTETEPPAVAEGNAPMAYDSGTVFVPRNKKLLALDARTGMVLWARSEDFPGKPGGMILTGRGIVVLGMPHHAFINLIDPKTGKSLWTKPFRDLGDGGPVAARNDTAYVAAKGKLVALDLATGTPHQIAKVQFDGGEEPCCLETRDEGLLLIASQNLQLFDSIGALRYHRYFKAPGTSLFAKIASTALVIGLNVASAALAQSSANASGRPQTYPIIVGNPVLSARFKASVNAERHAYIYTGEDDAAGRKGFSLVKLDKVNGRELGRVWLNERSPQYRLDGASGIVVLKRGDHALVAFRF